jgi:hypothetical protein
MGTPGLEHMQESSGNTADTESTGAKSGALSPDVIALAERLAAMPPETLAALRALLGG